jgi:hypothetical protein
MEAIHWGAHMAILDEMDATVEDGVMEKIIESSWVKESPQNGRQALSRK